MAEKPRLCEVNGRAAIFHRWVDKSNRILDMGGRMLSPKHYAQILDDYTTYGITSGGAKLTVITETFALVEYDDGSVDYVEPTEVKFIFFSPSADRAMELKNKRKTNSLWKLLLEDTDE